MGLGCWQGPSVTPFRDVRRKVHEENLNGVRDMPQRYEVTDGKDATRSTEVVVSLKRASVVIDVGCGVRVAIEARHLVYRANTSSKRVASPMPKSTRKLQKREQPKTTNEFESIEEENVFWTSTQQIQVAGDKMQRT
ncbi:uncharacterized protein [Apostichopus japonicus]|uniref:uncharacterized protein n=1 Tax=Stichopus japonicus TaxID=307972 RepID=UPI003AB87E5C